MRSEITTVGGVGCCPGRLSAGHEGAVGRRTRLSAGRHRRHHRLQPRRRRPRRRCTRPGRRTRRVDRRRHRARLPTQDRPLARSATAGLDRHPPLAVLARLAAVLTAGLPPIGGACCGTVETCEGSTGGLAATPVGDDRTHRHRVARPRNPAPATCSNPSCQRRVGTDPLTPSLGGQSQRAVDTSWMAGLTELDDRVRRAGFAAPLLRSQGRSTVKKGSSSLIQAWSAHTETRRRAHRAPAPAMG